MTAGIFVVLTRHLVAIWPLYTSSEVRREAQSIMLSLRTEQGIATSFFLVDSVGCHLGSCQILLKEQVNLITTHAPRQRVMIAWQKGLPAAYTLTYAGAQ